MVYNIPHILLIYPQLNHLFTKNNKPNWTIIHIQLDHPNNDLLKQIRKKKMEDLPAKFNSKQHKHGALNLAPIRKIPGPPWIVPVSTLNLPWVD